VSSQKEKKREYVIWCFGFIRRTFPVTAEKKKHGLLADIAPLILTLPEMPNRYTAMEENS
jgi:hypothetical protein